MRVAVASGDGQQIVAALADVDLARCAQQIGDHLTVAIEGSGAFGRFTGVLRHTPDAEDHWYEFSNEHRFGRARAWLTRTGKQPRRRACGAPTS